MPKLTRRDYLKHLIAWWGRVGLAAITVLGTYDLFTSQMASDWPRLADALGQDIPWFWYVLAAVSIVASGSIEGGYRLYASAMQGWATAEAQNNLPNKTPNDEEIINLLTPAPKR